MDSSSSATPKRFRKVRGLLSSGKKRKKKKLYHTLSDVEDDNDIFDLLVPFDESPYDFDPNRNLQQEFTMAHSSPEPKQPMENKAWQYDSDFEIEEEEEQSYSSDGSLLEFDCDSIHVDSDENDMPSTDEDPDKIPIEQDAGSDDESDSVQLEEDASREESTEAFENDTNSDPGVKGIERDGDQTRSTPVENDGDVLQFKEDEPMEESMEPSNEGDPDQRTIVNSFDQYADQAAADTIQTEEIVEPFGDESDQIESASQGESDASSRECAVDADQDDPIGICNTTDETEATSISEEDVVTEQNVPIKPSTVGDDDILDHQVDQLEYAASSEAGETMERVDSDNEHAKSTERSESTSIGVDCKVVLLSGMSPALNSEPRTMADGQAQMLELESKRRSMHHDKLEAIRFRWRSSLSLLREGLHETRQSERLILGFSKANHVYASTMKAAFEDMFLDDKGETVAAHRKQQHLLQSHRNLNHSRTSDTEDSSCSNKGSCHITMEGDHGDDGGDDSEHLNTSKTGERCDGILDSVIESQTCVTEQFEQDSILMDNGIGEDITAFRSELETRIEKVERLGNAIFAELVFIEEQIAPAWDAYDSIGIFRSDGGTVSGETAQQTKIPTAPTSDPSSPLHDESVASNSIPVSPSSVACFGDSNESSPVLSQKKELRRIAGDIWLAEMRYRVLVAYQSSAWEKARLSDLFESVLEIECERQARLHELLLAFVPRQRRLFSGGTSSHTHILDQMRKPESPDQIRNEIESVVAKHADSLQHNDSECKVASKTHVMKTGENAFKMDLESLLTPLSSSLVCSSIIMERKGGWKGWKKVLVVVTADYYLHLFDVPPSEQDAVSPEDLFLDLVPDLLFPTSEGGTPKDKLRSILKEVNPTDSVFLPRCTLVPSSKNGRIFEIMESVVGRFGQCKTRKMVLRTGSENDACEWIESLRQESPAGIDKLVDVGLEENTDPFMLHDAVGDTDVPCSVAGPPSACFAFSRC